MSRNEMSPGARREAVAIGSSAGGITALRRVLAMLPADFSAVFIVQHLAAAGPSQLAEIFDRAGPLPVTNPVDGKAIEPGRAYVAPPDRHLLVDGDRLRVTRGARENLARPAIDPLFRTAAAAYGSRLVGVLLTGRLYDGAAGLADIASAGGATMVQSPGGGRSRRDAPERTAEDRRRSRRRPRSHRSAARAAGRGKRGAPGSAGGS